MNNCLRPFGAAQPRSAALLRPVMLPSAVVSYVMLPCVMLLCAMLLGACANQGSEQPSSSVVAASSEQPPACAGERNPFWGVRPLPLASNPSITFDFTISEDHFDACEPLSWAVLSGMAGPDFRKAVVFFEHGSVVVEPAPLLLGSMDAVERIDPNTVVIRYRDGEAATFTLDGKALVLENNTLAQDAIFSAPLLDLSQFTEQKS
ncbi:LppP/LprE family lipoprotein [Corynebacterium pelargi]|uniref:Uncharacterized protein n=2 Tax=Corynebacterium pelargi TaxID=1471400 RepID=A0A410W610_9CORY|nr:LppP/LprE family lipoprotein [Corynebacterium pelargi]QAU51481.1 hypothetical protein CPELA_00900 [Corynebacterium pelargi]GGG79473.1 hypothetical protein GCM10007338_17230 [Corynebacterium pelargi]